MSTAASKVCPILQDAAAAATSANNVAAAPEACALFLIGLKLPLFLLELN